MSRGRFSNVPPEETQLYDPLLAAAHADQQLQQAVAQLESNEDEDEDEDEDEFQDDREEAEEEAQEEPEDELGAEGEALDGSEELDEDDAAPDTAQEMTCQAHPADDDQTPKKFAEDTLGSKAAAAMKSAIAASSAETGAPGQTWHATAGPNSSTHNAEYKAFALACKSKSFPASLESNKKNNRLGLFSQWLESGRDWGRVLLTIRRRVEQKTLAQRQMGWIKVRKLDYPEHKLQTVVNDCKRQGLWKEDKLFPKDEEEAWVMMEMQNTVSKIGKSSVGVEIEVQGEVNAAEAEALLTTGPLGDKDAVHLSLGEAMMQHIDAECVQTKTKITKGANKAEEDDATPIEPQGMDVMIEALRKDMLREAGEAKSLAVALSADKMSVDLQKSFQNHSSYFFKAYKVLQLMVDGQKTDEEFAPLLTKVDRAMSWYATRSKAARAWWNKMHPVTKAKAKAKAKGAAKRA